MPCLFAVCRRYVPLLVLLFTFTSTPPHPTFTLFPVTLFSLHCCWCYDCCPIVVDHTFVGLRSFTDFAITLLRVHPLQLRCDRSFTLLRAVMHMPNSLRFYVALLLPGYALPMPRVLLFPLPFTTFTLPPFAPYTVLPCRAVHACCDFATLRICSLVICLCCRCGILRCRCRALRCVTLRFTLLLRCSPYTRFPPTA